MMRLEKAFKQPLQAAAQSPEDTQLADGVDTAIGQQAIAQFSQLL